jgi:hypothetical protein
MGRALSGCAPQGNAQDLCHDGAVHRIVRRACHLKVA